MAAVPEHGIVSALRQGDAGGVLLRRLAIPILIVPLALGWLRLWGESVELFDAAFGTALRTLAEFGVLFAFAWWASKGIRRREFATFEADTAYDQRDAEGFIRLNALRLRIAANRARRNSQ